MRFLVDAHLPPRLCLILVDAGHDAIHTSQLPEQNRTTDNAISALSIEDERVVISKDTDFYYSHILYQRPYKLLLVRTGNLRAQELLRLMQRELPTIVEALEAHTLVEIDRSTIRGMP